MKQCSLAGVRGFSLSASFSPSSMLHTIFNFVLILLRKRWTSCSSKFYLHILHKEDDGSRVFGSKTQRGIHQKQLYDLASSSNSKMLSKNRKLFIQLNSCIFTAYPRFYDKICPQTLQKLSTAELQVLNSR
jgi:hypothetical protein